MKRTPEMSVIPVSHFAGTGLIPVLILIKNPPLTKGDLGGFSIAFSYLSRQELLLALRRQVGDNLLMTLTFSEMNPLQ
jgi:hypothetical protein